MREKIAMIALREPTRPDWIRIVQEDFDSFLVDHAACEHKASATAMRFALRFSDHRKLVEAMIPLAREELMHFHRIYRVIAARGLTLGPYEVDPYVRELRALARGHTRYALLDRLLIAALVEARACERLGLVAQALPAGRLKSLYEALTRDESRHQALFVEMSREYFAPESVRERLDELLDAEAAIVEALPLRPAVH